MFPKRISRRNILLIFILVVLSLSFVNAQDESYVIPDNPEGADPDMVIATVGGTDITLGDFFQHLRLERFLRFDNLNRFVTANGPEVLILDDPANGAAQGISQYLENIANAQSFGEQVYRTMILQEMYHQELVARGLEIDECQFNQIWVRLLQDQTLQTAECEFSDGLEAAKQDFIDRAMTFSGMTQEEVEASIRFYVEVQEVGDAIGAELELPDVDTIRTSHIRVSDEETAQAVMDALDAGDPWYEVMYAYTEDTGVAGTTGGALPPLQPGATVPEFDAALFDPTNQVGDLLGPIETQFGYHIIEIQELHTGRRVSHILFSPDQQEEADIAVQLLRDEGVDFASLASQYSTDLTTKNNGGDLGFLVPGNTQMPDAFNEAVFAANVGDIIGPIETERGFHVAVVTEDSSAPVEVVSRHILVDNEELAQSLLDRINNGEDFATLANIYSLDGAGNHGDTWSIISGGQATGAYALQDMFEQFPALALGLRDVEQGQIVGPLNTQFGYFIVRIEETGTRPPTDAERTTATQDAVDAWQLDKLTNDVDDSSNIWREFIVFDPMPSDVSDQLADLDIFIERSRADAEEFRVANSIPNVLSRLTVSTPIIPDVEATPEVEVTPDIEATPEIETTPEMDGADAEMTPEATPEATEAAG